MSAPASTAVTTAPASINSTDRPTKSQIAAFSHADIDHLSSEEMLQVIRLVGLPYLNRPASNTLSYQLPETLKQLTHLACRCCRNQGF